jgi:hypothetical protein
LVHQASGVGRIQLGVGEVVRRRVAQVDDGVGDHGTNVDESSGVRRIADRWHVGLCGRGVLQPGENEGHRKKKEQPPRMHPPIVA